MARILIVDDKPENRYMLEVLLKGHGHEVETASNGAEALAKTHAAPPSLVVSDLLMPVMDGFALLREWRRDDRLKRIPFVVYTATFTEPKDEKLALDLGADRFVIKPQEPAALLGIVEEALAGRFGGEGEARGAPSGNGEALLKEYNEALFRKLEKKLADLEASRSALRESEEKYRIVADNTFGWEFWLDPAGRFLYCSPSCLRVTGRGREEFLADPGLLPRIVHPEDRPRFEEQLEAHRQGVACRGAEFRILHQDGSVRWIAHDCVPLAGEKGPFLGTRGSNRDVTEKKRLVEQLQQARRMEAVGTLAGEIAGQFNQLMGAIIGSLDHIPRRMDGADPLRESLDQILAATARASALTRDLLAFSRGQPLSLARLDLGELVRGEESRLREAAGGKIRLTISTGEAPLPVRADRDQLARVLENLAVHARQTMPRGGTLSLATRRLEMDEAFIRRAGMGRRGIYGLVSVADDGPGMGDEDRQRVFEPFFGASLGGVGTGMGLAVAYGVVKQHEGYILVESEPGKGTTFDVAIPLAG